MAQISKAVAIANNEVAYLAWDIDTTAIPCCLGFHIVREYLDDNDQVTEERPLASYVAFKGQRNPEWQAQNTSVWPVQKFNWRDLTLRKKRNAAERRPDNERVRYRIRAVGKLKAGLDPVEVVSESHRDFKIFFAQPGGRFHAALYELEDVELLKLLTDNAARLDLILSDAGSGQDEDAEPNEKGKQPTIYDTRNAPARAVLRAIADIPGSGCTLRNRLFNGTGHIGHNKFVVWLDDGGTPRSVITGSTNWTWSGVAGQSNNCVRIDDDAIAGAYFEYWTQLKADKLPEPTPLNAKAKGANQGDTLKMTNRTPSRVALPNGASAEIWFSPNMPGKQQPPSKSAKPALPPPDMDRLFSLLRKAEKAIFFLVFMPSRGGVNSVVSEAIALGLKDTSLNVVGAISDTQAMWGYEPSQELPSGKKLPAWSPHVFQQAGISVIRATALTDRETGRAVGDFKNDETLTLGRAIIHDKVLVIDPMDPEKCVVAFGSHNFGYKASYSNDENLVIVEGHAALAQAYAAHVLDVYDHYRFRAAEAEVTAQTKKHGAAGGKSDPRWDGFLDTTDDWQKRASHRMSAYFTR